MNNGNHDSTGQRMTRQRRLILEVLRSADDHPTADEVYLAVRKRMPRISLATVYRNLDLLESSGQIGKARFGDAAAHFDGRLGPHHHVRCVRCGRIADVPIDLCEVRAGELSRTTGYELVDCHVEISGICEKCQKKESRQKTQKSDRLHKPSRRERVER